MAYTDQPAYMSYLSREYLSRLTQIDLIYNSECGLIMLTFVTVYLMVVTGTISGLTLYYIKRCYLVLLLIGNRLCVGDCLHSGVVDFVEKLVYKALICQKELLAGYETVHALEGTRHKYVILWQQYHLLHLADC